MAARRASLTVAITVGAFAAVALGVFWAEQAASDAVDAEMAELVRPLLGGGSAEVEVTDDPGLLAYFSSVRQQAVAEGRDADGNLLYLLVYGYDTGTGRADGVTWVLQDRPFADGRLSATVPGTQQAEGVIDGRRVVVQVVARREAGAIVIEAHEVFVDDARVAYDDLPDELRTLLAPARTPDPAVDDAAVDSVGFTGSTVDVTVYAVDVAMGAP